MAVVVHAILVDPPHPASLPEDALLAQCDAVRGRSGGPGGQNRNKVETKVTLTHVPTGVWAQAGERRSGIENRRVAVKRLRLALAVEARAAVRLGDARSDLWKQRCRAGRISVNPSHWDYPALLAEAMDMLFASKWDPARAALRLECTASQIVKLLKDHPPAFARFNAERQSKGKHGLL
jgi:hypothetical protein